MTYNPRLKTCISCRDQFCDETNVGSSNLCPTCWDIADEYDYDDDSDPEEETEDET